MTFGGLGMKATKILFILFFLSTPVWAIEVSCRDELKLGYDFISDLDYSSALYQFRRVQSLCDEKEIKERAEYMVGITNIFLNRNKEGQVQLQKIIEQEQHTYKEQAAFMISFVLEKERKVEKAKVYLSELLNIGIKNEEIKDSIRYKLAWLSLKAGDWEGAREYLSEINCNPELRESAQQILQGSEEGKSLQYKSPALAGILSGFLPGAGQVYAGRPKDGFTAFLVNGLFIGATIQAFKKDQEFLGIILGGLELGWYAGNIYNAVNSTHKYNRKLREDFLGRFKDSLQLNLLIRDKGELGVLFGFRF